MSPKYDHFLLPPLLPCWFKKLSSLAWTFAFIFVLQPLSHFRIPYPKSVKAAREVLLKCLLEYSNGYFSYSEKNLKSLQTAYNMLHDWVLTNSPLSTSSSFNLLQPATSTCAGLCTCQAALSGGYLFLLFPPPATLFLSNLMAHSLTSLSVQISSLQRDLPWPLYLKLQHSSEIPHTPKVIYLVLYLLWFSPH